MASFIEKFQDKITKNKSIADKEKLSTDIRQGKASLDYLPQLMGELFLNGCSLELINGDLMDIPDKWLCAVLDNLAFLENPFGKRKITECQISSMSMMGIQSSGKSTFLNSMFNLNYHTGNDRCTAGSNAVLLPINKKAFKSQEIVSDFLVLIDTEGLNSNDLMADTSQNMTNSKLHMRDNKLACFNAGLSNLTVFNMMSEFDNQITAIMSMLIYSMIRLKECEINPMMKLIFQARDFNQDEYDKLFRNSIGTLKLKFHDQKSILKSELNFEEILRFQPNHELKMISNIVSFDKYSYDYIRDIESLKQLIFSEKFFFQKQYMTTLGETKGKIENLKRYLTFDDFHFNAKNLYELEKHKRLKNLKLQIQKAIRRMTKKEMADLKEENLTNNLKKKIFEKFKNSRDETISSFFTQAKELKWIENKSDYLNKIEPLYEGEYDDVRIETIAKFKNNAMFEKYNVNKIFDNAMSKLEKKLEEVCENPEKSDSQRPQEIFSKIFQEVIEDIEQNTVKIKENLYNLCNPENKINFVFDTLVETEIGDIITKFKTEMTNKYFIDEIEKILNHFNFEEYPSYFEEVRQTQKGVAFSTRHSKLIDRISTQLSVDNLGKRAKSKNSIDDVIDFDLLEKVVFGEIIKSIKNNEITIPLKMTKYYLLENKKSYKHLNYYYLHIFLFCTYTFKKNCRIIFEEQSYHYDFAKKFREEKKDLLNVKFMIKYKGLSNGEALKTKIVKTIILNYVADKVNEELEDLFIQKMKHEFEDIYTHKEVMKKIQLDLLKSEPKYESEKTNFISKIIQFASNFKKFKKEFFEKKINNNYDKNIFKDKMHQKIDDMLRNYAKKVKDDLKFIYSYNDLEDKLLKLFDVSTINSKWFKKSYIEHLLESENKESEKTTISKLKNCFKIDDIEELKKNIFDKKLELRPLNQYKKYFLKDKELCLAPCFNCRSPCIREKGHGGKHETDYHIPEVFNGIYFSNDPNTLCNKICNKNKNTNSWCSFYYDENSNSVSVKNAYLFAEHSNYTYDNRGKWYINPNYGKNNNINLFWEVIAVKFQHTIRDYYNKSYIENGTNCIDMNNMEYYNMTFDELSAKIKRN